jgi:hypothetical protein
MPILFAYIKKLGRGFSIIVGGYVNGLRNIKTTLGMNILSCKTPEMCRKEIWTYFLANNLIRLLMSQAANNYDLLPRQLSFKHAVQVWNTYVV